LCVNQLKLNASEAQKKKYLPKLISGEHVGALAMSEPGAGSDVVGMRMTAVKQGNDYVLNGSKMWITNGPDADIVVVYAKTSPEAGSKGITTFIVEKGTPGFSSAQKLDKLGMRGSATGELVFDNCVIPAENVIGELDRGVRVLMSGLDYERVILSAGSLGIMQACMDTVIPYVHEREQFGQPIGRFQGVSFQLADLITEIDAADLLTLSAAWRLDQGLPANREIASAKLHASETLAKVTDTAIQIFGGMGLMSDLPLERFWRDARVERIWDGTSEIQRHIISRELLRPLGA